MVRINAFVDCVLDEVVENAVTESGVAEDVAEDVEFGQLAGIDVAEE
jgi:hypothetical protein